MTVTRTTPREDWPEFFRVEEFSTLLDISKGTAYQMVRARTVEAVRCGRLVRIPRGAVERLLGERNGNG